MNTQFETGKVYSLFNASGKVEEIKKVGELPMYCKVYIYGYGMSGTEGAIISEKNQFGQYKVVKISDYHSGFSTLNNYSRPHSKKFGIGIYYDDDLKCWDEATVKEYIQKGIEADKARAEEAATQAAKDKKEIEDLPGMYPHLTPLSNAKDVTGKNLVKANLVADLKKNFPDVKFSVSKSNYSTYNVRWTDGPITKDVNKITDKYEDSHSDYSGDYHDYDPSNFNRVFGGFKFVFTNRDMSENVNKLLPELIELLGNSQNRYPEQILHSIFGKTYIPANAINFDIVRTACTCGNIEDFYKITFNVPEIKETINTITSEGVAVRENNDKNGIEIIFGSKPSTEVLSALKSNGFKWSNFAKLWWAVRSEKTLNFAYSL